jgi:hypothetical protein
LISDPKACPDLKHLDPDTPTDSIRVATRYPYRPKAERESIRKCGVTNPDDRQ